MKKKIYISKKWLKDNPIEFIKHITSLKKFPCTYLDEKCKKVQCRSGKSRSLGEIVIITRTYFPKLKEKFILNIIYNNILINNVNKHIIYCPDVKKLVLFKQRFCYSPSQVFISKVFYDYRGYMKKGIDFKLEDHISIKYFLKKIGFTKKEIKRFGVK